MVKRSLGFCPVIVSWFSSIGLPGLLPPPPPAVRLSKVKDQPSRVPVSAPKLSLTRRYQVPLATAGDIPFRTDRGLSGRTSVQGAGLEAMETGAWSSNVVSM